VYARWNPIPKDKVRGVLLGYIVKILWYNNGGLENFGPVLKTNNTNVIINSLKAKKSYELFVSGYTANTTGLLIAHPAFRIGTLSLQMPCSNVQCCNEVHFFLKIPQNNRICMLIPQNLIIFKNGFKTVVISISRSDVSAM